jgi:hypothetical protein
MGDSGIGNSGEGGIAIPINTGPRWLINMKEVLRQRRMWIAPPAATLKNIVMRVGF